MKKNYITIMFLCILSSVCYSESPVYELTACEVPFVGEKLLSSTSQDSKASIKINYENDFTGVEIFESGKISGEIKFNKNISVHSACWKDESCWFLLRQKVTSGGGSLAVSIVKFNNSKPKGEFEFFEPYFTSKNMSIPGRIFDLKEVKGEFLIGTLSFHNRDNGKISYFLGRMKFSQMSKQENKSEFVFQNK